MKVITISGEAQHGKDSLAGMLKKRIEATGNNVFVVHYADYLKFIASKYFGWDGQKDEKGRTILQKLGTEVVRDRYPDFWVDTVVHLIQAVCEKNAVVLIPDCRFPNEAEIMSDYFYTYTVKVVRTHFDNGLTKEQKQHPSERAMDGFKFDLVIKAENGLNNLELQTDEAFEKIKTFIEEED